MLILLAVIVVATILALQFRWHWYPLQYLYFLRVPLVSGLLFGFCWLTAIRFRVGETSVIAVEEGPFRNLFVMALLPLGLVSFVAVLTAWTIIHSGRWIYAHTPRRLGLSLWGYARSVEGSDRIAPVRTHVITTDPNVIKHLHYALLALPVIVCAVALSDDWWGWKVLWALGGTVLAFVVRYLGGRALRGRRQSQAATPTAPGTSRVLNGFVTRVFGHLDSWFTAAFGKPAESASAHEDESPNISAARLAIRSGMGTRAAVGPALSAAHRRALDRDCSRMECRRCGRVAARSSV